MKTITALLFAALLVLPACNRTDTNGVRAASEERAATDQMKQQRDDYVKTVEAKLDEFDKKFDGLDERARAMSGTARTDLKKGVDALHDQRNEVSRRLDDLKSVSLDSWTTLKGGVDGGLADLEDSYQQVSASHDKNPATAPASKRDNNRF